MAQPPRPPTSRERRAEAATAAEVAARSAADRAAAESRKQADRLLAGGAEARFAALSDETLHLAEADRRRLLRSLVGKEPPRRAIPTGTASRWALIRSRLAYRKTALASSGFMLTVLLTGILMARANTPLGLVVSNASQDWSVPFKLKDGQVAFDRLEAGRSYALVRRDGGGDVLRRWAPGAGYAEAHIPAGYVHEAPGGLVTPPAAGPPAGW